ncbi:protein PLASTID MOVEMENT IMPAIRED 2-like [Glycine soja]|uniref:protein PLASTID MOVEMENT IMPAIRED 2-like n=1 Tax=Glycine max TaxID=3847 RepID=UPI0003DEBD7B|nr:protein PLASTID MOVEMENT IMPAIRED 2-like [Glycine max]XP_028199491.1 protein PLASTID MOVEMENT IMPAIRED 2-like [Glycine soja]|eukprot:XP_006596792.1 protein PLASTID MOVEMENT IMPAIRED 2-like [Glycine max]
MGTSNSTRWEWNLTWRRDLLESELLLADTFIGDLAQQQVHPHREDKWIWKHDHSGYYSSKSGYDLIWRKLMGSLQTSDFVDLWKLKIPAKSATFGWRLIKDRNGDILKYEGVTLAKYKYTKELYKLHISRSNWKESEEPIVLQTITEELQATRKELALVREQGFQFMASLDVIRNEFKHVTAETDRLKKKKGKVDSTVQNLNFKILRAMSKLEPVSAAEEKARSIVMSKNRITIFSIFLLGGGHHLRYMEGMFRANGGCGYVKKPDILLNVGPNNEYEYLTNHAASAEEIADKKVAAADTWIEALKASEKEILMETKIAQREAKESKL